MYDATIQFSEILCNYLIETIGETVERQRTQIRRIAAKEIIKRDAIMFNTIGDPTALMVEIAELNYRLASASAYFAGELLNEPEPYSADGILFSALVHLVRIEGNLSAWGWCSEQIRALGLAINPGEEVAWPITSDWVAVTDGEGNCRPFYRLSS